MHYSTTRHREKSIQSLRALDNSKGINSQILNSQFECACFQCSRTLFLRTSRFLHLVCSLGDRLGKRSPNLFLRITSPKRDRLTGGRIYPQRAASSLFRYGPRSNDACFAPAPKSLVEMLGSSVQRICLSFGHRPMRLRAANPPILLAALNSLPKKCLDRFLGVYRFIQTSAVTSQADGSGGRLSKVEPSPILPNRVRAAS